MQRLFKIFDKLTQDEVFTLTSELNRPQLWKDYECQQQINFTLLQLQAGKNIACIRDTLKRKYSISKKTAYRRISEALGHPSRYGDTNAQYDEAIINKFKELIVMGFIPNKIARRHFMADGIQEAGFSHAYSRYISRLIPDIIVFNAVFVNPRPVWLEIIAHNHCYLRIDDKLIYIGHPLDFDGIDHYKDIPIRANYPELKILAMPDDEALTFDPTPLIEKGATGWEVERKWYNESPTKVCIDLRTHLKEFTEAATDE